MATVLKRQESRRRLAATAFLTNISLDGTNTKLGPFVSVNRASKTATDHHHRRSDKATSPSTVTPTTNQQSESSTSTAAECCETQNKSKTSEDDHKNDQDSKSSPKTRRQSCSLPLGRHSTSKDSRSSTASNASTIQASEGRPNSSSVGSYKKNQFDVPSTSGAPYGHHSCQDIVAIDSQQSLKSRTSSINRSSDLQIPGKTSNLCLDGNGQKQQVHFMPSPRDYANSNEKYMFITSKRIPLAMFSYIPYSRKPVYGANRDMKQDPFNKRRHASGTHQLSTITDGPDPMDLLSLLGFEKPSDGLDISYSCLLNPTSKTGLKKGKVHSNDHAFVGRCISYDSGVTNPKQQGGNHYLLHQMTAPSKLPEDDPNQLRDKHQYHSLASHMNLKYNPDILDDPELIAGKHSTLLDFPSYLTSIINYVKPSDLKKELNEKFKERFPCIQLTLSKMRSLKRDMCKIAKYEGNIDHLTVAQAYVYFEKLILRLLINKQNRKLCAGACLLLSAKLSDVKGAELKKLIERIESVFRLDRKDLFAIEFGVLVALDFGLHLPISETLSHYQRLMYET